MNVRDQFAYYSLQCLCPNQVSKADGQGGAWGGSRGGSREAQGPGSAPPGRDSVSHTLFNWLPPDSGKDIVCPRSLETPGQQFSLVLVWGGLSFYPNPW